MSLPSFSQDGLLKDVRVTVAPPDGTTPPVAPDAVATPASAAASSPASELQYGIEDTPPWYLCIILGFQVLSPDEQ